MSFSEKLLPYVRALTKSIEFSGRCMDTQRLLELSERSLPFIGSHARSHLDTCPTCAMRFSTLRGGRLLADLPRRWMVHMGAALHEHETLLNDGTFEVVGRVDFESRTFCSCEERDWTPSATGMRVNLVMNRAIGFLSLVILDAPIGIESIGLMTPKGLQQLTSNAEDAEFELAISADVPLNEKLVVNYADVCEMVLACKLQLIVDMADQSTGTAPHSAANDVCELLEQHQAIERSADYVLPSGRHSDTYVNIGSLCSRDDSMSFLASKIDFLFWDCDFDTVLANGWAMSLIGRRLAEARELQGNCRDRIRQALAEGYSEPMLLDDIAPGSRVLILLDVVVTGTLTVALERLVRASGSKVVGVAAVVQPHGTVLLDHLDLRALCEVEMEVVDAEKGTCPRCNLLSQQFFNPIAGCMTIKASSPRSPSQFLDEDGNARELWQCVEAAGAYEHHRREGDTHYIGFIDTRRLLETPAIGRTLTDKMIQVVRDAGNRPTILLVPNRARAGLFARMLKGALREKHQNRLAIITASRRWLSGRWELATRDVHALAGADVLIVDTGAGHGRTIDRLASLCERAKARRISAAVLLSRLTPPCEDAFNVRLSGGFHRLFNLPIRPVAIRGNRMDLCPVCRRKNAIRQFAKESDIEPLEQWAESLFRARRASGDAVRLRRARQLTLFEERPFLSGCGAGVASGVTLHALGASRVNGSAPLSLPELVDDRIPWRARATMVENLPSGVLAWTGDSLLHDLVRVLDVGDYPSVWKATANLLSREGSDIWLERLECLLTRLTGSNSGPSESFWNHMACNAFLLTVNRAEARDEIRFQVDQLLKRDVGETAQSGLRRMREVIEK